MNPTEHPGSDPAPEPPTRQYPVPASPEPQATPPAPPQYAPAAPEPQAPQYPAQAPAPVSESPAPYNPHAPYAPQAPYAPPTQTPQAPYAPPTQAPQPPYAPPTQAPQPPYNPDPQFQPPPAPAAPPYQPGAGSPYPPVGAPGYPPPGTPWAVAGPPVVAPPPRKRSAWKIVAGVLVTLLIVCGVVAVKTAGRIFVEAEGNELFENETGPEPPKTPYEGSLAESYPVGEAGIVLPTATVVDGFTEEEVAESLAKVKEALVAARLDPTMIVDRDTTAFIALFPSGVQSSVQEMFDAADFMQFATHIAPGYSLTSDPVRVKGEMTFNARVIDDIRFLEVKTNYVWVYPFTGELKEPGDHLVVVHDEVTWLFPAAEDVLDEYIGLWLDAAQSYSSNIDCELFEQSLLALGKPKLVLGGDPVTDEEVFDPNGSLNLADTC